MKIHLVGKDKTPCQCAWCRAQVKEPEVVMSTMPWPVDGDGRDVPPDPDIVFGRAFMHN